MGSGTIRYKLRTPWGKRVLLTIEVVLYVLFVADCFVEVASMASTRSYFPAGGGSLIVLLLLIGGVHRLRCGRDYGDYG